MIMLLIKQFILSRAVYCIAVPLIALQAIYMLTSDFDFYPVWDSATFAQFFSIFYSNFFYYNDLTRWAQTISNGVPTAIAFESLLSPFQMFFLLFGKIANTKNSLLLFKLTMLFEQIVFIFSSILLAEKIFRHIPTQIFVISSLIAGTYWATQIHLSFRIFYLLPLMIYYFIKFRESKKFTDLLIAMFACFFMQIGNAQYCLPIFIVYFTTFFICFALGNTKLSAFIPKKYDLFLLLTLLATFAIYFYLNWQSASNVVIGVRPPGKSHDIPYDLFVTYGGFTGLERLTSYFFSSPPSRDIICYAGVLPCLFFIYYIFNITGKTSLPFLILFFTFTLMALANITAIPSFLFSIIPFMKIFRHIAYMLPVAKVLLLFIAGFGFDRFIESDTRQQRILIAIGCGLTVAMALFALRETPTEAVDQLFKKFDYFNFLTVFFVGLIAIWGFGVQRSSFLVVANIVLMTSYSSILYTSYISKYPHYETTDYSGNINYKDIANKQFQLHRTQAPLFKITPDQIDEHIPLFKTFYSYLDPNYELRYFFFNLDTCYPGTRSTIITAPFDLFLRIAFLNKLFFFQQSIYHNNAFDLRPLIEQDALFYRYARCNKTNTFIANTAFTATSLDDAIDLYHLSDINTTPIIFDKTAFSKIIKSYNSEFFFSRVGLDLDLPAISYTIPDTFSLEVVANDKINIQETLTTLLGQPINFPLNPDISKTNYIVVIKTNTDLVVYNNGILIFSAPSTAFTAPFRLNEDQKHLLGKYNGTIVKIKIQSKALDIQSIEKKNFFYEMLFAQNSAKPGGLRDEEMLTESSSEGPNRRRFTVNNPTDKPVYLVINDAYDEEWLAYLDNNPTTVLPCNIAFKAVEILPGKHDVLLIYGGQAMTFVYWYIFVLSNAFTVFLIIAFCRHRFQARSFMQPSR